MIMNKGNTKKGLRIIDIPYFDDWNLWLFVVDRANGKVRSHIANAVIDYLKDKNNLPINSTHKAYWQALHNQSISEGVTISTIIQRACSMSMNIAYTEPVFTHNVNNADRVDAVILDEDKGKVSKLGWNPFDSK
jgi:hypothetical protein